MFCNIMNSVMNLDFVEEVKSSCALSKLESNSLSDLFFSNIVSACLSPQIHLCLHIFSTFFFP